jgi:hypothetical protein
MKPTKEQIKQYYSQAVKRCLESFALLDDREWDKKASGGWTAGDYLAHMVITQEEEHHHLLQQALAGQPGTLPGYDQREDINDFNERQLAKLDGVSIEELLERLKSSCEADLALLDSLSEADLDKPASSPGWDRPGTVRDIFFSAYLHLPGHYQDIRRVAKKKLPHWMEAGTPEEVHFQLDRIFHFMPLTFWSERGADMEATYLFNMEGPGGGKWALKIGGGKAEAEEADPGSFDVEVRTKPELWIDLTTNELNPVWAITTRKVQLGGNSSLAMKLGPLFQVNQ